LIKCQGTMPDERQHNGFASRLIVSEKIFQTFLDRKLKAESLSDNARRITEKCQQLKAL